jgi:hypothetical protein
MSVQLQWVGLDELRKALLRLPAELTAEAADIVNDAADAAAVEIREAYPEGETGNLKKGVRVRTETGRAGPFTVRKSVRSTAPHANIFEVGTKVRTNKAGANRGFMPGANIFVPVVTRRRRVMFTDLLRVLEEAGLDVRGR